MNIIITLDYELFLNDMTGTVNNCLIKPMQEIQKVCDKHNIRLTVFVDAAYLYRLTELKQDYPALEKDYDDTVNNIKWLVSLGHDVQLHIHPQWYYSNYDGKEWILDWDHYKLSDIPRDYAFELFGKSKELLDSIIGYKTTLFRAGGYSIQDFDYAGCFKQHGIIGDSSVLPGCKVKHKTHSYDYVNSPIRPYRFSEDINSPQENGLFYEFPISKAKSINIVKYLYIKRWWGLRSEHKWGDGGDKPHPTLLKKIKSILSAFSLYKYPDASIDHQSFFWLRDSRQYMNKYDCMTVIGHPKNISSSSLLYLDEFINERLLRGDCFISMNEYLKNII